jgi:hypothetical protein
MRNFSKPDVSKEFYLFASAHGIPIVRGTIDTTSSKGNFVTRSIQGEI